MPGESEEDVVERWLVDLHVVHGDTSAVERPDHGGGEAGALRTGARSRRPSWLTWTSPDTKGPSAAAAPAAGELSVTSRRAPPVSDFSSPEVPSAITAHGR